MHSLWITPVYHNINHSVQQLCSQHDLQLHLPFHQSHVSPAVSLYSHPEDQWKQCLAPGLLQHPLWDTVSDDNSTNKFHLFSDICQWKLNAPVETTCTSLNSVSTGISCHKEICTLQLAVLVLQRSANAEQVHQCRGGKWWIILAYADSDAWMSNLTFCLTPFTSCLTNPCYSWSS